MALEAAIPPEEVQTQTEASMAAVEESIVPATDQDQWAEPPGDEPPPPPVAEPAGDDTSASEQVAEPEPADATSGNEQLLREARERYGFSDQELNQFQTTGELQATLAAMDRRISQLWRDEREAAPEPGKQEAEKEPPDQLQAAPWKPEKFELSLPNEEEFDPEVIKMLQSMNDHYQSQMEQAAQQFAQMNEQVTGVQSEWAFQQATSFERETDDFFSGLPEQYHSIFGTGPIRGLSEGSAEVGARAQLVEEAVAHQGVDAKLGRPLATWDEYRQRALRSKFGHVHDQEIRAEVRGQADKRRRQAIARPTSRQTKAGTPEERAGDFANKFFQSRGIAPTNPVRRPTDDI